MFATVSTAVTFRYAITCAVVTFEVVLSTDPEGVDEVGRVTSPSTSVPGFLTFAGLRPGTDYFYRWSSAGQTRDGLRISTPIVDPDPSPTPTPTPTFVCPPVVPSLRYVSAAPTTLTFDYQWLCGARLTLLLYSDAQGTDTVFSALTTIGHDSGRIVLTGLPPATSFYYAYHLSRPDYTTTPAGPVSTSSGPVTPDPTQTTPTPANRCTATMTLLSHWDDGFLASIRIINPGEAAIHDWRLSWAWTGGQSLTEAYNSTAGGTPNAPVLTPASWNERIEPGASATALVLGRGPAGAVQPEVACTAT